MSDCLMRKFLAIFFSLSLTPILHAETTEDLVYVDYVANADSSRSLLGILNAASPIRQRGQVFHGYTEWHLSWNFRWLQQSDGRCKITTVTTKLKGKINLPKLVGATSIAQKEQFDKYLSALRIHELGHYSIGKQAATEVEQQIRSLPEMPSCRAIDSAANQIGYRTLNEYKEKETRYDDVTSHGKSQGAWLER